MKFVKNPLTMWGRVERCWLLAFRAPVAEIQALLPSPLLPVTHGGYAFYNVVVCRIKDMRPKPLPRLFGFSYWHVAYRVYVRFRNHEGQWVEGLYFLRSDCDKCWLVPLGNRLTDFRFHPAQIDLEENADEILFKIKSQGSDALIHCAKEGEVVLQEGSPFSDLSQAADFLKYKPAGIGEPSGNTVQIVRIKRDENQWKHRVVPVKEGKLEFFKDSRAKLELCYQVNPIEYVWSRGKREVLDSSGPI